jgi:hypothetical protein
MQTGVKQVFYFNAGANALGGFVEDPYRAVPSPSSVSLSPTGGLVASRAAGASFENVLSYRSAYTFVTGQPTQMNGPWTHRVVSVIEGLNLMGRVTADHLIAQIAIEHPAAGQVQRMFSFVGSQFVNLHVDGKPITPTINPTLGPQRAATIDAYNQSAVAKADTPWSNLWATAYRQATVIQQDKATPSWVHDRYSWVAKTQPGQPNPAGYSLCSLVDSISGLPNGQSTGHAFDLPELGRVFLGEIVVHPFALEFSMLRAELGCPFRGQISFASIGTNGTTCPPS